jgi:1-aminocyclopropane-1-carboxylate deaminase/D-cysteine desulfhydrase-like pyridoxal-dependent ACC family enzyme
MVNEGLIQGITSETHKNNTVRVSMLRLDKLHPVVSGNKLFKLKYHLQETIQQGKKSIVTMGGPYSNHLVAAAYASQQAGLHSIGIVRGNEPEEFSHTLTECIQYGMRLIFCERDEFDSINAPTINEQFPEAYFIAQGGYGLIGAKGSSEILSFQKAREFDFIIAACGTGTMGAGLVNASSANQKIILISVLKNNFSIKTELENMIDESSITKNNFIIKFDFHFGGYAKKNKLLFESMNQFYIKNNIETDFVYTGKMVYAVNEMIKEKFFPSGSNILMIHSGGLQGNRSLQNGELLF